MVIQGLSHLTFVVRDLEKSAHFLTSIFDAEEIYNSGDRFFGLNRERFLLIGGLWICIMEGDPLSQRSYNHVAFSIPDEDFEMYQERILALGLEVKPSRPRVEGEGRSLYFYDYDNHLFELHAGSPEERLRRYSAPQLLVLTNQQSRPSASRLGPRYFSVVTYLRPVEPN